MNNKIWIFTLAALLSSFPTWAIDINKISVIHVSSGGFTIDNKKAVSVYIGESQQNYCSLTISRRSVQNDYNIDAIKNDNKEISADCNWDGKYYVQSSKHKTHVSLDIKTLDKTTKKAQIKVNLKLINPANNEYFEIANLNTTITGEHFETLTK